MGERDTGGTGDAVSVSEAYVAARDLVARAEQDAARIRADADRYLRQREQEAELLVGKARRLLELAEQVADAPRRDLVDLEAVPVAPIDLDSSVVVRRVNGSAIPASLPDARSQLDVLLATAIANAVHRALPSSR